MAKRGERENLEGRTFGHWTVLEFHGRRKSGQSLWLCKCVCGRERPVDSAALKTGKSKRCRGCPGTGLYRHGKSCTPLYAVWSNIKSRCTNPKASSWKQYGARGIKVCPEWANDFLAFAKGVGEYRRGYVLTLIDETKDFMPGNVQWRLRGDVVRQRFAERAMACAA